MTAGYRLTPRAREGLHRIAAWVEERFGVDVAERVTGEFERSFGQLAANPGIGHLRQDLTRDERVRFWSVGPTLVAYRSKPEGVEILFVERGDLDWERMLMERLRSPLD